MARFGSFILRTQATPRRRAFTLIETGFVMVLIGFGVIAVLQLLAVGTVLNANSQQTTQALTLANNIHEIAIGLPFYDPQNPSQWTSRELNVSLYDNLLDLDGQTFSPPLSVNRQPLTDMSTWSQSVTVTPVADHDYALTQPKTTSARCARVTVAIWHNNQQVYQRSWIAASQNVD